MCNNQYIKAEIVGTKVCSHFEMSTPFLCMNGINSEPPLLWVSLACTPGKEPRFGTRRVPRPAQPAAYPLPESAPAPPRPGLGKSSAPTDAGGGRSPPP